LNPYGDGRALVENSGVPARLNSGKPDPGLLPGEDGEAESMLAGSIKAIAKHRHFEHAMDPPGV